VERGCGTKNPPEKTVSNGKNLFLAFENNTLQPVI
jgi:hypothetical protein